MFLFGSVCFACFNFFPNVIGCDLKDFFVKWFSMIQLFQAFHSLSVPARCPAHKTGWFNGYNGQNFLVQGQLPLQMMHIEELQFVLWGSLALCLELGLGHWPLNSCTAFARWLQADLGFHCFLCWPLSRGLGFTAMSPRWCLKHCRDCWKAFSVLMTLTNLTPSVPFQKLTCGLIWEMMRQMQTLKTWLKHIRKMHGGMQKVTEDSNGFQGILEQRFPFSSGKIDSSSSLEDEASPHRATLDSIQFPHALEPYDVRSGSCKILLDVTIS